MNTRRHRSLSRHTVAPVVAAGLMAASLLLIGAPPAVAQERESRAYPPTMEGASEVAVYKKVGDVDLKLYVFQPAGNRAGSRTPAIVFFYGGGWTNGSPEQWHRQCMYLSSRGMVAIAVDYRVRSRHNTTPLDAVRDAKSSMRWVRQHANRLGIDPSRIAAAGGSAGGHLAAAVGVIDGLDEPTDDPGISSRANALVLYNPAVVLAPVEGTNLGGGRGGAAGGASEDRSAISPYHHVTPGDPPTITFHGKKDATINYLTAEIFTKKMVVAGNRAELVLFDHAEHGFFNSGAYYSDVLAQTDKFLSSLGYLKEAPTVR
jgi:acetyl esterase/lipase